MDAINNALQKDRSTLSEYESKKLLASYGIPITREILVTNQKDLESAVRKIGFPLVLKGSTAEVSHKTEKGLVRVDIRTQEEAIRAFQDLLRSLAPDGGILVQEMIEGKRELVAGLTRDPQFGPCVMFGLGGIFTEILEDVAFRVAPLNRSDALAMMEDIRGRRILDSIRGMEPVDREALASILINLGKIGLEHEEVQEIDINPLIVREGIPVAVDALVVIQREARLP